MDSLPRENVRILLTSRLRFDIESPVITIRLLDEEESKKLLSEKVFGEDGFPPHLEKFGEKIAKKCEGLPLMIVTVAAGILSKKDKTLKYWTKVVEKQHNSVFTDAYNQISEVLFPSYKYLPQYLKMFFLYLGAFPPYSDIEVQKLFQLLSVEGFLEPMGKQSEELLMLECMEKLADWYHLLLLESKRVGSMFSTNKFRVLSCWQHVCKK